MQTTCGPRLPQDPDVHLDAPGGPPGTPQGTSEIAKENLLEPFYDKSWKLNDVVKIK